MGNVIPSPAPSAAANSGESFTEALLQQRDYTIILGRSCASHQVPHLAKAWQQAQDSIQALIEACARFDADGITLYLASSQAQQPSGFQKHEQVAKSQLSSLLQDSYPPSKFDCVSVLETAIEQYFERKAAGQAQANGEIFLLLVDGEPVERKRLTQLVVKTTARMAHKNELAIGLVQIGEDPVAQGLFQFLDDDLQKAGATYDMVHTQKVDTLDSDQLSAFLWDVLTD